MKNHVGHIIIMCNMTAKKINVAFTRKDLWGNYFDFMKIKNIYTEEWITSTRFSHVHFSSEVMTQFNKMVHL